MSEKPGILTRVTDALTGVVDGAFMRFAPRAGLQRLQARNGQVYVQKKHDLRMEKLSAGEERGGWSNSGGFQSTERSRDAHSWLKSNLSPYAELEYNLEEMRLRSNSAYKNYELFAGHVERRVNRIAGTGVMVAPRILSVAGRISPEQAPLWNQTLRNAFERWAHKAGGDRMPLYVIQRMIVRHIEKDGVAFVQFGDVKQADPRVPVSLRVKVIHPRRVSTPPEFAMDPSVRLGVKIDVDTNEILGYYVRTVPPGDNKLFEYKWDYVEAKFSNGLPKMIHISESREADQVYGYPQGQVTLKRLKNTEEYEEADLERNIIASCYGAFVFGPDPNDAAAGATSRFDRSGDRVQELAPGRVEYMMEGAESIQFSNPPGPQAAFTPYIDHQNRMAAAGLCTSYEAMSGHWAGVSYSGGKLIYIDEQGPIDCGQLDLIELFLIPVWQLFVNRCITSGIIDVAQERYRLEPWIFECVKFVTPKRPSIDPARERTASLNDVGCGVTPFSDEVEQMNGRPAEDVIHDVQNGVELLDSIGLSLADLRSAKGGTPLGGSNDTAAAGGEGRQKRETAGAAA